MPRATRLRQRIQPTRLGSMLRLSRTINQLDLRFVARQIGIGHATLMRIEHGETFDVNTFMKLWRWLLEPETKALPDEKETP